VVSAPSGKSSVLGIAAWLRAGRFRVQFLQRQKIFVFCSTFRTLLGPTQSPIQWLREAVPGIKQPGREVDSSFPSSVRIENCKGKVRPMTGH
jgi:hypothetical protein